MPAAIALKLDQDTQERIKRLAASRQRTSDSLMKEAINQYLTREEKRAALRSDAVDAWKESQDSGMHAGADEVTAWLESWGEDSELPAPICHK